MKSGGIERASPWWSVSKLVAQDRDYRGIAGSFLLVGVSEALVTPYLALWVTRALHGSTWQAAFLFVPFGLVVVVTGLLMSAYSDRGGRRRGLILISLLTGVAARLGLAFTTSYPLAVVLFAITGFGPFGLLFALLSDAITDKSSGGEGGSQAQLTTTLRTIYSLGWLIGPVVGGLLLGPIGFHGLFLITAVLQLGAAAWAWSEVHDHRIDRAHPSMSAREGPGVREMGLLLLLFLIGLLLFSGDVGRENLLALYLTRGRGLPISAVSLSFAVAVAAELLFLPLAGRWADRAGVTTIFTIGIGVQALYFFGMGTVISFWIVLPLQVVYAFVVATSEGVGIVFAQRTFGGRHTALATSTYLVSRGTAPLLNSLLVGIAAIGAHLDRLFLLFGLFACAALLATLTIARRPPGRGNT